jgi:glycosyl-4,4'-diaponeurosporenoate acyltransferase
MSPLAGTVLADCLAWACWSLAAGLAGSRLPAGVLSRDRWLFRIRPCERDGRRYERFGIRRWKDAVPEAGSWFGGPSKRDLGGWDRTALDRFAVETRRAEAVHWVVLALTPFFVLWNPFGLFLAMVAYGVIANVPCIAIQRYNRARIERIRSRRALRRMA